MAISSVKFNQQAGRLLEKSISGKNAFSRFLSKKFEKAVNEPAKFASSMLVTSIISKDLVGCFLYTSQSLNNKKIPEDKRGAVASLDLVNGFLMVGGQFLVGKVIESKLTPQLFGKFYSGKFTNKDTKIEKDLVGVDATKKSRLLHDNIIGTVKEVLSEAENKDISKTAQKIREMIKKENISLKNMQPEEAKKQVKLIAETLQNNIGKGSAKYKLFEAGFGLIVTALATTALVKRTLVPLISTPLSAWFKDNVLEKQPVDKDTRFAYEAAAVAAGRYENNMDKTAFSNMSLQRSA